MQIWEVQWWETQVKAYPAPAPSNHLVYLLGIIAGVLKLVRCRGYYANGADVFDMDISYLSYKHNSSPIGSVTTQPATPANPSNPIYGASQKDGCTPIDEEGCLDSTAINFNVCCNPFPGCLPTLHNH